MPKQKIAVEEGLDNIRVHLSRNGFQVIGLDQGLDDADAVVISGIDPDLLGFTDPRTDAPIILARGRTPEDVLADLNRRL